MVIKMKRMNYLVKAMAVFAAVIVFCAAVLPVFAADDGVYQYRVENGNAVITAYLGSGLKRVELPKSLGGYPVTGVDKNAFGEDKNGVKTHPEIETLIIPAEIEFIGDRAFEGTLWFDSKDAADDNGFLIVNNMLINYIGESQNITIPNSAERVNIAAFEKNDKIKNVILPKSVTIIDDYAFYRCTSLETVTIKGDITSIGKSAFYGCTALEKVIGVDDMVMPDSLNSVGENAFYNCTSLSGIIDLGLGIKNISTYAFANCRNLGGIRVADTLEKIGSYPFGFRLEKHDQMYYPIQEKDFVIYVSHLKNSDKSAEKELLKSYSKTAFPIYKYSVNPDSTGYFSAFTIEWDRLDYDFMYGDVNNDGRVSTADARAILRHALKLTLITNESDFKAGDVNKDSKLTSSDSRTVLRAAMHLDTLPAE